MKFFNLYANICCIDPDLTSHADEAREKKEEDNRSTTTYVETAALKAHPQSPDSFAVSQHDFLAAYPQYAAVLLDTLRETEFKRINNMVYLDYAGAALYPEFLVRDAGDKLTSNVFGNPHSSNPPSRLAAHHTEGSRTSVLRFFDADPDVYTVVWTANASAAMRIVGEGYDWNNGAHLFLGEDSHNSMNGLREFALRTGATVDYYRISSTGGWHEKWAILERVSQCRPLSLKNSPGIFCLTGQSNVTGFKAPLYLLQHAAAQGFHTLLDAAALAPTTQISLCDLQNTVDAMAISIYKITGFPTGGTVDVAQVPGQAYTLEDGSPRFEDGTINFLSMPSIPRGLSLVSTLIPLLSPRLASLTHWTSRALSEIKHARTGRHLVHVRSPSPRLTLSAMSQSHGALISFEVSDASGAFVNCEAIEYGAGKFDICLRAGCMCNPGGASCLAGMGYMMGDVKSGDRKEDLEARYGVRSRGVVRASFGMGSNFADAWAFVKFMRSLALENALEQLLAEWAEQSAH